MPTAQDIYDVLIKDPQYEGVHGLSREEVVEREANRRARQHANNEKALSMAVQNSAMDKLFDFIWKAASPLSPEERIVANVAEWNAKPVQRLFNKGLPTLKGASGAALNNFRYYDFTNREWSPDKQDGFIGFWKNLRKYMRWLGAPLAMRDVEVSAKKKGGKSTIHNPSPEIDPDHKQAWENAILPYMQEKLGARVSEENGEKVLLTEDGRPINPAEIDTLFNTMTTPLTKRWIDTVYTPIMERYFPSNLLTHPKKIHDIKADLIKIKENKSPVIKGLTAEHLENTKGIDEFQTYLETTEGMEEVAETAQSSAFFNLGAIGEGTTKTGPVIQNRFLDTVYRNLLQSEPEDNPYIYDLLGDTDSGMLALGNFRAWREDVSADNQSQPLEGMSGEQLQVDGEPVSWNRPGIKRNPASKKLEIDEKYELAPRGEPITLAAALTHYVNHVPAFINLTRTIAASSEDDPYIPNTYERRLLQHFIRREGDVVKPEIHAIMESLNYDSHVPEIEKRGKSPLNDLGIELLNADPDDQGFIPPEDDYQSQATPAEETAGEEEVLTPQATAQKLINEAGLDRFHEQEFLQWMGKDTTGVSAGAMHMRQGRVPLKEVLQNTDLEEFQKRLAHYKEAHELYPEPKQGEERRGGRLGADRMQQRAAHYREYWEPEDSAPIEETGGGGTSSHWTEGKIDDPKLVATIKRLEAGDSEKDVFGDPEISNDALDARNAFQAIKRGWSEEDQKTHEHAIATSSKTLAKLNADHISLNVFRGSGEPGEPDTSFKIVSPVDDEGGPGEGRDKPYHIPGSRKDSNSAKGRAMDMGLIDIDEAGAWKYTPKGETLLKPTLDAVHKVTPVTGTLQIPAGTLTFRTQFFHNLLNDIHEKQLPTAYTEEEIKDEHNNQREVRTTHDALIQAPTPTPTPSVTTGDIIDEEEEPFDIKSLPSDKELPTITKETGDEVVRPKNARGQDYNPFEDIKSWEDIDGAVDTLKGLYRGLHAPRNTSTGRMTLGRGDNPSFPMEDRKTDEPHVITFKKDEFSRLQERRYNELNTQKAVIEEYLRLFANINKGTTDKPWAHLANKAGKANTVNWYNDIWPEIQPDEFIPRAGGWQWLNGLHSVGAVDAKGTADFHGIPSTYRDSGGYNPLSSNLSGHFTKLGAASKKNVMAKQFIEQHPDDFGGKDFLPHIPNAWRMWRGTPSGETMELSNFYSWLKEADENDIPRFQSFIDKTEILGETEISDETQEVDEEENLIATPLPGTGAGDSGAGDTGGTGGTSTGGVADEEEQDKQNAHKQKLIDQLMAQEYKNGVEKGSEDEATHRDYLESLLPDQLRNEHVKHVVEAKRKERQDTAKAGIKLEETKAKEPSALGDNRRKELIEEYINTYREQHTQSLDPRFIKILQDKSDKDLQQEHEKLLREFGVYKREEAANLKESRANNIDFSIKPLAPLQEHLTKDDIMMQARRLIHHNAVYGKVMDSDAKKVWKERMAETHQLADAANMNLDLRLQEDMEEADEKGDFGSTSWLERVGEAHVDTQTRRNAHRDAVSRGSELRTNVNYKPHIYASYDDDGNFQGFHDLKNTDEYGRAQAVDSFDLRFNEDDHYHFHGLDPEKVKDYQTYLTLKQQAVKERPPGELPLDFGPPSAPPNPKLAELEKKVRGIDYKDIQDRFSAIGDLPGAQQLFHKKFTKDAYGRHGLPANPDGSGMAVPRFYRGESDKVGTSGWYHPESESWINPHRYQELIDHMGGQPNSGRVIADGGKFYGKGVEGRSNPTDSRYAFALPTEAKRQQLRSGDDNQSYYVDDTGGIAHAHSSFEAGNTQSHDQPQTVNGVIHDWNAQQIGNQMKSNPSAFVDEQGRFRQVAVIDTPPASVNPPPPIQNMWLELAAGESLGREKGSALERREKKKQSGWEWFDRKLGGQTQAGRSVKDYASRTKHPLSSVARDPLSAQELGQTQWWSRRKELKQQYYDVLDWAPVPLVSWAGRVLLGLTGLGREKPEDKVIRRIRQGYKVQAETEKLTREAALKTMVNGQRLSDQYVAPGEQNARTEDYQELKRYFTNQTNFHQNQKDKSKGNKASFDSHEAQRVKWVGLTNTLGQYDSRMPHQWKDINDMYTTHLGKVNQALPAEASMNDWGTVMRQPPSNRWGVTMRQPDGGQPDKGQPTKTGETLPLDFEPIGESRQLPPQTGETLPLDFGTTGESRQLPLEKISAAFSV